jgi:hypothetical protein
MQMRNDAIFVGVDLSAAYHSFNCVALDQHRNIVNMLQGSMEDLLALLASSENWIVAINAPQALPVRRMTLQRSFLADDNGENQTPVIRQAEKQLLDYGLKVPVTAPAPDACPRWMRYGFNLYRQMEALDAHSYPAEVDRQWMEVQADAVFWCLLNGVLPRKAKTLEGRMQRQLVLYDCGLKLEDPMRLLEEITRFRLKNGEWNFDSLLAAPRLNAAAAAYTAWLVGNRRQQITQLGNDEEGFITLPEIPSGRLEGEIEFNGI